MNGQFKPSMSNYLAMPTDPKTNNHLKEWHNWMERITRKAHPPLLGTGAHPERTGCSSEHSIAGGRWSTQIIEIEGGPMRTENSVTESIETFALYSYISALG